MSAAPGSTFTVISVAAFPSPKIMPSCVEVPTVSISTLFSNKSVPRVNVIPDPVAKKLQLFKCNVAFLDSKYNELF
ncbi:MAG: hypothetical protein ACD_64C00302G0003 [uncultured bacterium]|nr:MAG: hypothetical protein ACD_64C00302G0003 [uncultured bacterium]